MFAKIQIKTVLIVVLGSALATSSSLPSAPAGPIGNYLKRRAEKRKQAKAAKVENAAPTKEYKNIELGGSTMRSRNPGLTRDGGPSAGGDLPAMDPNLTPTSGPR